MPASHLENVPAQPASAVRQIEGHNFIAGSSPAMRAVERVIVNLSATDIPVFILGESGTGKRAAAFQIHRLSSRRDQALMQVSCATISPQSFGVRGNGKSQKNLTSALADAGTIIFEEISDLRPAYQLKLLQALAERERVPLPPPRLISTGKKSLDAEVSAGRFREDLYYRLNGVCLPMPSLRQRKEDIPLLVKFFLAKYAAMFLQPEPLLTAETQAALLDYSWPGNVRELENTIRAIVAVGDETVALAALRASPTGRQTTVVVAENLSLKQAARAASRQAERELILKVLSRTHWNRKHAAQELQISYKALLYKLKQIRLDGHTTD